MVVMNIQTTQSTLLSHTTSKTLPTVSTSTCLGFHTKFSRRPKALYCEHIDLWLNITSPLKLKIRSSVGYLWSKTHYLKFFQYLQEVCFHCVRYLSIKRILINCCLPASSERILMRIKRIQYSFPIKNLTNFKDF